MRPDPPAALALLLLLALPATPTALTPAILLATSSAPVAGPDPGTADPGDIILRGRLFDAREGAVIEDGVVIIRAGRVACSGAADRCRLPDGVPLEEYGDAMILPGLIDMHVHARRHYVGAFLPSGVTTVRDVNNALHVIRDLRSMEGVPRLFASGPLLDGPDSFLAGMTGTGGALGDAPLEEIEPVLVADADGAREAVEALADAGVDLIKLYQGLDSGTFAAAVEAARERALPVAADVGMVLTGGLAGVKLDLVQAAEAGITTNEHLSGLALAYQRRGGDPSSDDLDEGALDAIARDLLATDLAVVPTVGNAIQFAQPGSLTMEGLPGADLLVPWFEEGHWPMLLQWASQAREPAAADLRLVRALLPRLHRGGMTVAAGSDLPAAPYTVPGPALHQELEALVRVGLEPTEALRAATIHAATLLGRDDLGHLEAGARADVVVVDGDPTRDILESRSIRAVWLDGEKVDRDAAWSAVERELETVQDTGGP